VPELGLQTIDEAAILTRAVEGDGDAFGELYDLHVARIYRYIYYMTRSPTEAEDLTAQTFLKAWQAISRYEMRGPPFIHWLLRIAYNVTLNYLRGQRRHETISRIKYLEDRALTPEKVLEQQDTATRVRQALLRLAPSQRQVLVLRFIEGLPYCEIADIMGKSIGAIRVIQHRALNNLRGLLTLEEDV